MLVYPSPCRDDLATAWCAAVDDAGLSLSQVALFWRDGRPRATGQEAASWRSGSEIEAEFDGDTAFEEALTWLNSDQIRDLRRVMVWTERAPEALAGLLRHELEHTMQIAAHVELEHLHQRACEEVEERGGTGKSYNAIPMEADANRASARFLRRRFGADRLRELVEAGDHDAAFFRSTTEPESLDTLVERMERFVLKAMRDSDFIANIESGAPIV